MTNTNDMRLIDQSRDFLRSEESERVAFLLILEKKLGITDLSFGDAVSEILHYFIALSLYGLGTSGTREFSLTHKPDTKKYSLIISQGKGKPRQEFTIDIALAPQEKPLDYIITLWITDDNDGEYQYLVEDSMLKLWQQTREVKNLIPLIL